jgi:hypothetical protein
MLRPWSEGTKDERASHRCGGVGILARDPRCLDEFYPRPVGERGRSPRRLTHAFSGSRRREPAGRPT